MLVLEKDSAAAVGSALQCISHKVFSRNSTVGIGKVIDSFDEFLPHLFGINGEAIIKASGYVKIIAELVAKFAGNKYSLFRIKGLGV